MNEGPRKTVTITETTTKVDDRTIVDTKTKHVKVHTTSTVTDTKTDLVTTSTVAVPDVVATVTALSTATDVETTFLSSTDTIFDTTMTDFTIVATEVCSCI